jgi:hypothetical protein
VKRTLQSLHRSAWKIDFTVDAHFAKRHVQIDFTVELHYTTDFAKYVQLALSKVWLAIQGLIPGRSTGYVCEP